MTRCGLLGVSLAAAAALAVWTGALPGPDHGPGSRAAQAQEVKTLTFTFIPPPRGAPTRRVGGATRGAATGAAPTFAVLAAETTSWASHPSPTLYWYLGADSDKRFVFTLIDDEAIDPVAELDLDGTFAKGFIPISLAQRNLILAPEVTYEWSISLITNSLEHSNDVISSGTLQYRPLDPALRKEIEAVDPETRLARFAQNGYWYDAIELIAAQIASGQQADKWRAYRSQLLKQVGLPGA